MFGARLRVWMEVNPVLWGTCYSNLGVCVCLCTRWPGEFFCLNSSSCISMSTTRGKKEATPSLEEDPMRPAQIGSDCCLLHAQTSSLLPLPLFLFRRRARRNTCLWPATPTPDSEQCCQAVSHPIRRFWFWVCGQKWFCAGRDKLGGLRFVLAVFLVNFLGGFSV